MPDTVLLTTSQAAQAVGVSASSLCRFSALGAPCSYTVGGHRRWDVDELREWMDDRTSACEDELEEEEDLDSEETEEGEEPETCEHCGAELEEDDPSDDGDGDEDEQCPDCDDPECEGCAEDDD